MNKTFLEIFSKFSPDPQIREYFLDSGENILRYDREKRIIEVETKFNRIVPKSVLYSVEEKLCAIYEMAHVKILPKYSEALLTYSYIPQILLEAERIGIVARGFFSDYSYKFDGLYLTV